MQAVSHLTASRTNAVARCFDFVRIECITYQGELMKYEYEVLIILLHVIRFLFLCISFFQTLIQNQEF